MIIPISEPSMRFDEAKLMSDKAAASILTFEVDRDATVVVVRCKGRLVTGVNNLLYIKVMELLPHSKRIVLDLTNLTYMDSTGLGTLVRLYVATRSAGSKLELIHIGKRVRELLGIANLLSVFTIIGESDIRIP
jgi:anti-sigma B factor antagonist